MTRRGAGLPPGFFDSLANERGCTNEPNPPDPTRQRHPVALENERIFAEMLAAQRAAPPDPLGDVAHTVQRTEIVLGRAAKRRERAAAKGLEIRPRMVPLIQVVPIDAPLPSDPEAIRRFDQRDIAYLGRKRVISDRGVPGSRHPFVDGGFDRLRIGLNQLSDRPYSDQFARLVAADINRAQARADLLRYAAPRLARDPALFASLFPPEIGNTGLHYDHPIHEHLDRLYVAFAAQQVRRITSLGEDETSAAPTEAATPATLRDGTVGRPGPSLAVLRGHVVVNLTDRLAATETADPPTCPGGDSVPPTSAEAEATGPSSCGEGEAPRSPCVRRLPARPSGKSAARGGEEGAGYLLRPLPPVDYTGGTRRRHNSLPEAGVNPPAPTPVPEPVRSRTPSPPPTDFKTPPPSPAKSRGGRHSHGRLLLSPRKKGKKGYPPSVWEGFDLALDQISAGTPVRDELPSEITELWGGGPVPIEEATPPVEEELFLSPAVPIPPPAIPRHDPLYAALYPRRTLPPPRVPGTPGLGGGERVVDDDAINDEIGDYGDPQCCGTGCDHAFLASALSAPPVEGSYTVPLEGLCDRARCFAAEQILRHPDRCGFAATQRRVISEAVHAGVLSREVFGPGRYHDSDLRPSHDIPPLPLYHWYTVPVRNAFDELSAWEDEVQDASAEEVSLAAEDARQRTGGPRGSGRTTSSGARAEAVATSAADREQSSSDRRQALPPRVRARNAENALRRIKARLAEMAATPHKLAWFVLSRRQSMFMRDLLVGYAPWLLDLREARAISPTAWLAACVFSRISPMTTTVGLFQQLPLLRDLAATASGHVWVRDLTGDGDVEANPGPVHTPLSMDDVLSEPAYTDWATTGFDRKPYAVEAARDYIERHHSSNLTDRGSASALVTTRHEWYDNHGVRLGQRTIGPWSTGLYPTTYWRGVLAERLQTQVHELLDCRDVVLEGGPVGPLPPIPQPEPQRDVVFVCWHEEDAAHAYRPYFRPLYAGLGPRAEGEEGVDHRVCPKFDNIDVFSVIDRHGPAAEPENFDRYTHHYGLRLPVCRLYNTEGLPLGFAVNGVPTTAAWGSSGFAGPLAPERLAQLTTVTASIRTEVVGFHCPPEGNGADARLPARDWGPPFFWFAQADPIGTVPEPTLWGNELITGLVPTAPLTTRAEVFTSGLVRNDIIATLSEGGAAPTTFAAAAFKLGLLADWARYGGERADLDNVWAWQTQVHQPTVRPASAPSVQRLVNNTGLIREDCGGLVCPVFPFLGGATAGRLAFHVTTQTVPPGQTPVFVSAELCRGLGPRALALFVFSLAPWPCANLSLSLETVRSAGDVTERAREIFSWWGTTCHVPGETELHLVLPRSTYTDLRAGGPVPVYVTPTFGGVAVGPYLPFSDIPVNTPHHHAVQWVPLTDFLVSWVTTVQLPWIDDFLRVVHLRHMWDEVSAFFEDGPSYVATHSGPVYSAAFPGPGPYQGVPPNIPEGAYGERDEVPVPMRCWDWRGEALPHIPAESDWPGWSPRHPSGVIPLPDLRTLSLIQAGVYVFPTPYHHVGGYLAPTLREFAAFRFAVSDRLHVAGSLTHRQLSLSCGQLDRAARGERVTPGLGDFYRAVFGTAPGVAPTLEAWLGRTVERVLAAPLLAFDASRSWMWSLAPPRAFSSQVFPPEGGEGYPAVLPVPIPDYYLHAQLEAVPRGDSPYVLSASVAAGSTAIYHQEWRIAAPTTRGGPLRTPENCVELLEVMDLSSLNEDERWNDRVLLLLGCAVLRTVTTGEIVAGALPAGQCPYPPPKLSDAWTQQVEGDVPDPLGYPMVDTAWMPASKTDMLGRCSLQTSQTLKEQTYRVAGGSERLHSAGILIGPAIPPPDLFRPKPEMGKGFNALVAKAGNFRPGPEQSEQLPDFSLPSRPGFYTARKDVGPQETKTTPPVPDPPKTEETGPTDSAVAT